MSESAVAAKARPARANSAVVSRSVLFLVLALAFVLGVRYLLYAWMPDRTSDFDLLYDSAARLVGGDNPYPAGMQRFPYPLPAVLLAVPFTAIPLWLARPIFDVLVGWAFVYALWKHRGPFALLAVVSGAYLFAMVKGQTTPLMVAASLIPALGFLLAVRPNTSAALWIARPSWIALLTAGAFLIVSLVVLPSWPWDWWMALPADYKVLAPPILRPFGFVLLLAAIRWRSPEARLIFATAFIPQSTLPYELVPLALVPGNRHEMALYLAGSWIALVAADRLDVAGNMAEWTATGWPVTLAAVYLPMLYLVLRNRQSSRAGPGIAKDRRRPNRLPDSDLRVDVSADEGGKVRVKVTHLPTQLSSTELGESRKLAERKAQDKLAAIVREAQSSRKDAPPR